MDNGNVVVNYGTIQSVFEQNPDQFENSVFNAATKAAPGDDAQRTQLLTDWHDGISALKDEEAKPNVMVAPRNAMASRVQSLLARQAVQAAKAGDPSKLAMVRPGGTIRTDTGAEFAVPPVLEVKFDNDDWFGWLGMAWKFIFKPEVHPWIEPPPVPEPIKDDAVIALFSDWGTGLYGAPEITKSIAQRQKRCDVALHLGDTYYSGADDEVASRLVGDWPLRTDNTVNRTLNGNHEMYSGGQGYFAALNSFFHQPASCFAMQNTNWVLICLDTSYKDFDIDKAQVDWLMSVVKAAGKRKLLLFSHHQPFSQLDAQGPNIRNALAGLLNTRDVLAWYWGHEHRLVLYEPHSRWGFKGRCIGNGGFPGFRDDLTNPRSDVYVWVELPEQSSGVPAAKVLDGPNFWVKEDPMGYSPHGFVVLEFDGVNAFETFKTPDNIAVSKRMPI